MYRALTLAARRRGVDVEDEDALVRLMETLDFTLSSAGPEEPQRAPRELWIDGAPPSDELESAGCRGERERRREAPRGPSRDAGRAASPRGGGRRDGGPGHRHGGVPGRAREAVPVAEPEERAGRRVEERGSERGGRRAPRAGPTGCPREPVRAGRGCGGDRHERSRRGRHAPGRAGGRRRARAGASSGTLREP